MDDLLEDSQEKEETQAAITLEEPHDHEARRVEDPYLGGRLVGEIQEPYAPKPPPPEAQKEEDPEGHKGQPGKQPCAPREGQDREGRPTQRT